MNDREFLIPEYKPPVDCGDPECLTCDFIRPTRKLYDLEYYEDLIHAHEESFIETFLKGDIMGIVSVRWNARNIEIHYVLECGQHLTNGDTMEAFIKWMTGVENGKL